MSKPSNKLTSERPTATSTYSPLQQEDVVVEVRNGTTATATAANTTTTDDGSVWVLGIAISVAYCCTYFWRYPIFMLPPSLLHTPIALGHNNSSHNQLDLQAWFSLAFIGGFGSSKLIGMQLLSSRFFFRYKLVAILAMVWSSMLIEGLGVALSQGQPSLTMVGSVYASSFIQSWIYGALITYLEGRQQTETLLAGIIAATIAAGGMARGTASLVLHYFPNLPPTSMPLVIGLVMATVASFSIVVAHQQPPPSLADQAAKCPRQPMTFSQQMDFFKLYGLGLGGVYLAYALLVGVRSFRDFYSEQIFQGSYNYHSPEEQQEIAVPSWVYLVADLPGALGSAVVIRTFQGGGGGDNEENTTILSSMVLTCIGFGGFVLVSTLAFLQNWIHGLAWQISLGIGIYGSFGILTTAIHDRLIAATRTPGTCTFLVLLGDAGAYVVTLTILLIRDFASGGDAGTTTSGDDDDKNNNNDDEEAAQAQFVLQQFFPMVFWGVGTGLVTLWMSRQFFLTKLGLSEQQQQQVVLNSALDEWTENQEESQENGNVELIAKEQSDTISPAKS